MTDSEILRELLGIVGQLVKKVAELDARIASQQFQTVYHSHSWAPQIGYQQPFQPHYVGPTWTSTGGAS